MTKPYFILPAANDPARLHDIARQERAIDFMRGVICGASLAAVAFSALGLAALIL